MANVYWDYFKFRIRGNSYSDNNSYDFLQDGMLVFDIGANIGNYVEVFLRKGARIVAVEPQPYCYRFLRMRFGRNKKVKVVNSAAGAATGQAEMQISSAHTLSSLNLDWIKKVKGTNRFGHNGPQWNDTIKVNLVTLDDLILQYGHPDYLKIDVEGFEKDVLQGLSKAISHISFEFTLPEMKSDSLACIDLVANLGNYQFESIMLPEKKMIPKDELVAEIEKISLSGTLANGDFMAHLQT